VVGQHHAQPQFFLEAIEKGEAIMDNITVYKDTAIELTVA